MLAGEICDFFLVKVKFENLSVLQVYLEALSGVLPTCLGQL
jgi:hypothetical protein